MKFATEKHWDKIACGYAINEAATSFPLMEKFSTSASRRRKSFRERRRDRQGHLGHASIPRKDNPVTHLAEAIGKIGNFEAPVQFNSVTRAYFEGLAPIQDEETDKWMRALESADRADHAARWISDANPAWNSMLRTPSFHHSPSGYSPERDSVRGARRAQHPLASRQHGVAAAHQTANPRQRSAIRFEVQPNAGETAPSSSVTSDLFNVITQEAKQQFPGAVVVPEMSTGATDSIPLRLRNVQAYGLDTFPLTETDLARKHADDERIPVDSFRKGIDFLYGIVANFALAK